MAAATGQLIRVRRGDPIKQTIELRDAGGNRLVDVFDGSEVLTVRLWAGDDRAAIEPAPVATWDDAPEALVNLDGDGTDTANLDRGRYKLEVLIDDEPVWTGGLEVLAAPGEGVAPPVYATYDGMLRRTGAWLKQQKDEAAQASFIEERHEALAWTHRTIRSRAQAWLMSWRAGHRGNVDVLVNSTNDLSPDTLDNRIAWLMGRLDDGALILDHTIIEANECYAIAIVLGRTLNQDGAAADRHDRKADGYMRRAGALLSGVVFRVTASDVIDPDDPEEPEPEVIVIPPVG